MSKGAGSGEQGSGVRWARKRGQVISRRACFLSALTYSSSFPLISSLNSEMSLSFELMMRSHVSRCFSISCSSSCGVRATAAVTLRVMLGVRVHLVQLLRDLFIEERRPLHRDSGVLTGARLGLVEELLAAPLPAHLLVDPPLVLAAVTGDAHLGHLQIAARLRRSEGRQMRPGDGRGGHEPR